MENDKGGRNDNRVDVVDDAERLCEPRRPEEASLREPAARRKKPGTMQGSVSMRKCLLSAAYTPSFVRRELDSELLACTLH